MTKFIFSRTLSRLSSASRPPLAPSIVPMQSALWRLLLYDDEQFLRVTRLFGVLWPSRSGSLLNRDRHGGAGREGARHGLN
jgi:hypothetical protein